MSLAINILHALFAWHNINNLDRNHRVLGNIGRYYDYDYEYCDDDDDDDDDDDEDDDDDHHHHHHHHH